MYAYAIITIFNFTYKIYRQTVSMSIVLNFIGILSPYYCILILCYAVKQNRVIEMPICNRDWMLKIVLLVYTGTEEKRH